MVAQVTLAVLVLLPQSRPPGSLQFLVERYQAGARQEAVTGLDGWNLELLKREGQELHRKFRDTIRERTRAQALAVAAVVLLTEAALLEHDARRDERAAVTLELAWTFVGLAERFESCDECRGAARRFYLLAGLMFQARFDLPRARRLFDAGLERFPGDGGLLLAAGIIDETLATRRRYRPPPEAMNRRGAMRDRASDLFERREDLRRVAQRYRSALAADTGLVEARIRLGRVLLLLERPAEAARELEAAVATARQPAHGYMSQLLLGRARERQDDLVGAAESYRAAARLGPESQAAHLALGRLLDAFGERAAAQQAFERALARRPRPLAQDPWWLYPFGQGDRIAPLLDELRGLVSR